VLLAEPPIELISEHIPDQFPLRKAQRLDREAYESPALPLSYSATVAKLIELVEDQQPRPMEHVTIEQHITHSPGSPSTDRRTWFGSSEV